MSLKGKYYSLYSKNFFSFFFAQYFFSFGQIKRRQGQKYTYMPTLSFFTQSQLCYFLSFSFFKGVTNTMTSQGLMTKQTQQ